MEVSTTTNFVIEKFKENPLVNTISVAKQTEIDHNKANIYPLVNVDLVQSEVLETSHRMYYIVHIYQQRDSEPRANLDNKLLNTNMIDNLNETYMIASKFINNVRSYNNEHDIDVYQVSTVEMLKNVSTNLLDGVTFTMTLDIPDSTGC